MCELVGRRVATEVHYSTL